MLCQNCGDRTVYEGQRTKGKPIEYSCAKCGAEYELVGRTKDS